jgi:HEXXH motif-containing protein
MDDLVERIRAAIEDRNGDPWFPELTHDLAALEWDSLQRDVGLTPESYGTERVLSRSISAPRDIITSLKTSPSSDAPTILVESAQQEWADSYRKTGVCFYPTDELLDTTILSCFHDALAIINQVPSLTATVASLVRSLHVIKPKDMDHDVSFSEPHVPFSIFISAPERRIANDALRVAEAIVHEAMHLQLTIIERMVPLAESGDSQYFSPWRGGNRTAGGVLHALYVFVVIDYFMARLRSQPLETTESLNHIARRRKEILSQVLEVESFRGCSALTRSGELFVDDLFRSRSRLGESNRLRSPAPSN